MSIIHALGQPGQYELILPFMARKKIIYMEYVTENKTNLLIFVLKKSTKTL